VTARLYTVDPQSRRVVRAAHYARRIAELVCSSGAITVVQMGSITTGTRATLTNDDYVSGTGALSTGGNPITSCCSRANELACVGVWSSKYVIVIVEGLH